MVDWVGSNLKSSFLVKWPMDIVCIFFMMIIKNVDFGFDDVEIKKLMCFVA
jgi:hypothetical protein